MVNERFPTEYYSSFNMLAWVFSVVCDQVIFSQLGFDPLNKGVYLLFFFDVYNFTPPFFLVYFFICTHVNGLVNISRLAQSADWYLHFFGGVAAVLESRGVFDFSLCFQSVSK